MSDREPEGEPQPPCPREPPRDDERYTVWLRVKQALLALPLHFSAPQINISGLRATDLYTLAAALGATIENQVVVTLNRMRQVWDPEDRYGLLGFVRQPQTFPDVLLMQRGPGGAQIVFGIELKSWYLLAKEREPTFRFRVSARVCTEWDLLVVVPWFLSDVVAGTPKVLRPYIESAKYLAEYRNYWWQHIRKASGSASIELAAHETPYPNKSDRILDKAMDDSGHNFGRIARTGVMDEYMREILDEPLAGIPARYWRDFFKLFTESADVERINVELQSLASSAPAHVLDRVQRTVELISELFRVLLGGDEE
jgi:hypothetical protein